MILRQSIQLSSRVLKTSAKKTKAKSKLLFALKYLSSTRWSPEYPSPPVFTDPQSLAGRGQQPRKFLYAISAKGILLSKNNWPCLSLFRGEGD